VKSHLHNRYLISEKSFFYNKKSAFHAAKKHGECGLTGDMIQRFVRSLECIRFRSVLDKIKVTKELDEGHKHCSFSLLLEKIKNPHCLYACKAKQMRTVRLIPSKAFMPWTSHRRAALRKIIKVKLTVHHFGCLLLV
jgi:hypothetical protein